MARQDEGLEGFGRANGRGQLRGRGLTATRDEAIASAGAKLAASDIACTRMTPREQAEAAWTPTSPYSVDELEDRIRARRGMTPINREAS